MYKSCGMTPLSIVVFWAALSPHQADCQSRVYVAPFQSHSVKGRDALLNSFTEQFEAALVSTGAYQVLDRRKIASLLSESDNEKGLLTLQNVPEATRARIQKLEDAHGVVFGEVEDDSDSGEMIITATLETFDSVKQWKRTAVMKRGLVQDYSERQKAINTLAAASQAASAKNAESIDASKPPQAAGANSQQIANSGSIGSITYSINSPNKEHKEVKIDPALFDRYVGDYAWQAYTATVTRQGDHLFGEATGAPKMEMLAEGDRDFFFKNADVQVTFLDPGADGKAAALVLHQKMGDTVYQRVNSVKVLAQSGYDLITRFLTLNSVSAPDVPAKTQAWQDAKLMQQYHASYDAIVARTLTRLQSLHVPVENLTALSKNVNSAADIRQLSDEFGKQSDRMAKYTSSALDTFLRMMGSVINNAPARPSFDERTVRVYRAVYSSKVDDILKKLQAKNANVDNLLVFQQQLNSVDDLQRLADGFKKLADSLAP